MRSGRDGGIQVKKSILHRRLRRWLIWATRCTSEEGVGVVPRFPVEAERTWLEKRRGRGMDWHRAVASYVGSHNLSAHHDVPRLPCDAVAVAVDADAAHHLLTLG